jgi:hypothetical protein
MCNGTEAATVDSTFGILDAFVFLVFAVLLAVGVIIIVSLGQLPGRLARKWGHPQAAAVNAAGWIGVATGGLVWPLAFIWAFIVPSQVSAAKTEDDQPRPDEPARMQREAPIAKFAGERRAAP